MKTKKIIVNWILISYINSDNFNLQKSILFLHGWGQDKMSFEKIYSILDENWVSYIWLDFPGFWMSDFPASDFSIFDYANFTNDFIDKIWLVKPVLLWHSFWWRICIILWSSFKNISKIVLIWAAWIKPKVNKIRLIITNIWKIMFSLPWLKWIWNKIKARVWSLDYQNSWKLKQIFLNTINEDLKPLLSKIKYQTFLIRGEKDTETPMQDWEIMNKLIPNSKLKIYVDGTHFVFQENSVSVASEILEFIK